MRFLLPLGLNLLLADVGAGDPSLSDEDAGVGDLDFLAVICIPVRSVIAADTSKRA